MTKNIIRILLVLLLFFINSSTISIDRNVYICGHKGAKKYHFNSKCRGLNNCNHNIYKKKESEAIDLGLSLCKFED